MGPPGRFYKTVKRGEYIYEILKIHGRYFS
jgi:hypothetical protein